MGELGLLDQTQLLPLVTDKIRTPSTAKQLSIGLYGKPPPRPRTLTAASPAPTQETPPREYYGTGRPTKAEPAAGRTANTEPPIIIIDQKPRRAQQTQDASSGSREKSTSPPPPTKDDLIQARLHDTFFAQTVTRIESHLQKVDTQLRQKNQQGASRTESHAETSTDIARATVMGILDTITRLNIPANADQTVARANVPATSKALFDLATHGNNKDIMLKLERLAMQQITNIASRTGKIPDIKAVQAWQAALETQLSAIIGHPDPKNPEKAWKAAAEKLQAVPQGAEAALYAQLGHDLVEKLKYNTFARLVIRSNEAYTATSRFQRAN